VASLHAPYQRIRFFYLKFSAFWPIWVQNKSKYNLRAKICTKKVNRPWYLNVPITLIYPISFLLNTKLLKLNAIRFVKWWNGGICWTEPNKIVILHHSFPFKTLRWSLDSDFWTRNFILLRINLTTLFLTKSYLMNTITFSGHQENRFFDKTFLRAGGYPLKKVL
jgi:hypothetical protein